MKVLGIEGTAWSLSAAVVDERGVVAMEGDAYVPLVGGIHPREAAQHHAEHIGRVVFGVLEKSGEVDGVAFSQGPGLGQCLRTVATAARSLALVFGVPLLGVNHCLAHIEIGRWMNLVEDPLTLYVSGANSQVLAYRQGKYRVFGETLDIGIGNALDKFARYCGLSHPGGPKIEEFARRAAAEEGCSYLPLPYVVKGMDFSFSGLITAAQDALKQGEGSLAGVCFSLQETAFAMLVEVTERAVAHTGKGEVLLVGGVGANQRLQEMLGEMCEARGINFRVPDKKFLGDNGAMIAHLGRLMLENGDTLKVEDSRVLPDFRPDDVEVTWR